MVVSLVLLEELEEFHGCGFDASALHGNLGHMATQLTLRNTVTLVFLAHCSIPRTVEHHQHIRFYWCIG